MLSHKRQHLEYLLGFSVSFASVQIKEPTLIGATDAPYFNTS